MLPVTALLVAAGAMAALTLVTARRPASPIPDREGYLTRWSALHHGYDPRGNVWVRGWLGLTYQVARPLGGLGAQPDVITLWGVWVACAVLVAAQAGDRWLLVAGLLVVLSGFGDTLDGAVAALTDRATRWGYVLDSLVDRVSDVLYLVALWVVGAPAGLAVAAGTAFGLLEYLRARAGNAGMGEIGVVTVGERPARVIVCAAALLGGGVVVEQASVAATVGLAVVAVLSAVGVAQLAVVVRRTLRS
jgi:phosphatidylglycerophosphate synthase